MTALLEAGADPNARAEDGQTPLHAAAGIKQSGAVATLLRMEGAGPKARSRAVTACCSRRERTRTCVPRTAELRCISHWRTSS